MKIGYICSLREQEHDANSNIVTALEKAGCQTIFSDLLDRIFDDQLNLVLALEYVRAGDTLVVWDISVFFSNTQNFVDIMQTLQQRDIGLQILAGNFSEIKARSWESQVMLESYSVLANLEHKYLS